MSGMKKMRAPHSTQRAERRSEVLMVASRQNAAASLTKSRYALTVSHRQTIAGVHREQPQFVHIGGIKHAEKNVITISVRFAIARGYSANRLTVSISHRREMVAE